MFDALDPALLDDPEFKEDSVREGIVVPILRRLGYSASGTHRIIRSKSLLHPFVMIGSKKHPVSIVPDYLLLADDQPGFILDAKSPAEQLTKSKHAEQAYSYAIHPEVRVRFYALCNGRSLVAYDIYGISPIFEVPFREFDREWGKIASVLSPSNVSRQARRYFDPDFGTAVVNMGARQWTSWSFPFAKLEQVAQVREGVYAMSSGLPLAGVVHVITFDIGDPLFTRLLSFTDDENRSHILNSLEPGRLIYTLRPLYATLSTIVGGPTQGASEVFIPFIVTGVQDLSREAYESADVEEGMG